MSYTRWPDDRMQDRHPDGHPAQRCGSAEWHDKLSAAESQSGIDSDPGNDRPAGVGCRPPRGWAESFFAFPFKAAANVLVAGQRQALQRIVNRVQVPLRQMQVLGGGLQVAMTEQNLDGAQV